MIRNVRGNNGMMTASSIAVVIVRCWAVDDLSDMIWVRLSTPKMDPFLIHDYIAPKMVNTSKLRCFPGKKNIETYRNDVGIWQYLGLGGTPLIPVPRNRGRSPKSAHETKRSHWVAFSACERRMALSMSSFIGLEKKKKLQERSLFWRWKARFPADLFFSSTHWNFKTDEI